MKYDLLGNYFEGILFLLDFIEYISNLVCRLELKKGPNVHLTQNSSYARFAGRNRTIEGVKVKGK